MIEYQILQSDFGEIVIARLSNKIIFLEFIEDSIAVTLSNISKMYPNRDFIEVDNIVLKFDELFDKHRFGWDKLSLQGTPFQLKVWETLFSINFGDTISYSDLALLAGNKDATRAVASAVASNPISLIVPCHRVIPKSESGFGNYRWGAKVKEDLIKWEASNFGVKKEIFNMAKGSYKEFSQSLIPTNSNTMLGVTIPQLRDIAKVILKADYKAFVDSYFNSKSNYVYYEELMVLGIVIAKGKFPLDDKVEYYKKFIPLIDNWAVCDIFCGESKWVVKSSEIGWNLIEENIASQDEFRVRFAVILMLSQLIKADYLSQIFKSINKIEFRGDYYVDMAVAWLLATIGAKFPNDLFAFIEKSNLPLSVLKKTAQKMRDSRRVSQEDKLKITDIVKSKI